MRQAQSLNLGVTMLLSVHCLPKAGIKPAIGNTIFLNAFYLLDIHRLIRKANGEIYVQGPRFKKIC